ncbi:MAG: hypothetical protein LC802_18210 [Acidobacteria bacterium]|nr:hypothetical protein [Acidobacteriota bacterium]
MKGDRTTLLTLGGAARAAHVPLARQSLHRNILDFCPDNHQSAAAFGVPINMPKLIPNVMPTAETIVEGVCRHSDLVERPQSLSNNSLRRSTQCGLDFSILNWA